MNEDLGRGVDLRMFSVSTHHDPAGVMLDGGWEDAETIALLERLAEFHATVGPGVAPLPPGCFRTKALYRAYRSAYDIHRTGQVGPEYFVNPDGSRTYNLSWLHGYGWYFIGESPDAVEMAKEHAQSLAHTVEIRV